MARLEGPVSASVADIAQPAAAASGRKKSHQDRESGGPDRSASSRVGAKRVTVPEGIVGAGKHTWRYMRAQRHENRVVCQGLNGDLGLGAFGRRRTCVSCGRRTDGRLSYFEVRNKPCQDRSTPPTQEGCD